jgi:hypothetical protein
MSKSQVNTTWRFHNQDEALAVIGFLWVAPQAALELPLTLTTRQAIEFYLAHGQEEGCRYHPGRID